MGEAGLSSFAEALADARFRQGLRLSFFAALAKVPVQVALGLAAALALQANARGSALARAAMVSPMFLGLPVTTFLFASLFDLNVGVVNAGPAGMGLTRVAWLTDAGAAQLLAPGLSVWRDVGLTPLVFLAGFSAIPPQVAQAARLDGAGSSTVLRTITLPRLARSLQFTVALSTLASFQMLAPVLMPTHGGPTGATDLASFQIYESAFVFFDLGRASAMSLILLAGLAAVIAVEIRWLSARWTYERPALSPSPSASSPPRPSWRRSRCC